jgi:hypothetical protein
MGIDGIPGVQHSGHTALGPVGGALIELRLADHCHPQVLGQVQCQAEARRAGADNEHIVLVLDGHTVLRLLPRGLNYIMRVKDLAFVCPFRASIYELATNKELCCCGTFSKSLPLIGAAWQRRANLLTFLLSTRAAAGVAAGQ